MKLQIEARNFEMTEAIRTYAEERIGHLLHYDKDILEGRVELEKSPHHQTGFFTCIVNLDVARKPVLRAESTQTDLYAAIDAVVPKLKEQLAVFKGKQRTKDRRLRRYMKTIFAWRPWRR